MAGVAPQRGPPLTLDANLVFNDFTFARAGSGPNNGNRPYATVKNTGGMFFAPYFGLSTDFDKLDRWTFAVGIYGPSSVGNRTFPSYVGSVPAPNRYDITKVNLLLFFPTLAAAYRAARWMDVGAQIMIAYGTFDLANASNAPINNTACKGYEYGPCDVATRLQTSGATATAALGLMFHVKKFMDIGLHVRGPVNLSTSGTVNATVAPNAPTIIKSNAPTPGTATFNTSLPWIVKVGARYIFRARDGFEAGDIELDGDYEAWHAAETPGDTISIPMLGTLFHDLNPVITHNYQDTFSVRIGGAYNARLPVGVLTVRLGAYYDSAATQTKDTRVDFDTMDKLAGTAGLGYRVRGLAVNVGYAYVWEPDRNVPKGQGDIRLINGIDGTQTEGNGQPSPVINEGKYHADNQIISIGLTVAWEELVGRPRRRVVWE